MRDKEDYFMLNSRISNLQGMFLARVEGLEHRIAEVGEALSDHIAEDPKWLASLRKNMADAVKIASKLHSRLRTLVLFSLIAGAVGGAVAATIVSSMAG